MCLVGKVSSMAHVDAVGYMFSWLKLSVTEEYPVGGTVSAPVKNESNDGSVTHSSIVPVWKIKKENSNWSTFTWIFLIYLLHIHP